MAQPMRLGRGLGALLDTNTQPIQTNGSSSISEIQLSSIVANPNQPRKSFDETALQTLADSIREMGMITPITVRKNEDDTYIIIAGERRYRAAQMAGLESVPAYVRTVDDEKLMELALIENIQREDLNSIEIALGYQRLIEEYGLTHEKIGEKIGMSRTNVSNYLRLLNLPAEIQIGLQNHEIEMGHARALLSVNDTEWQLKTYKQILGKKLSVRQVEDLARKYNTQKTTKQKQQEPSENLTKLKGLFGEKVKYTCSKRGKGQIVLPFSNKEELAELMQRLENIRK